MPNGQNPSQVADETQRRLGQKVYTTPENTKDPYKGDNSQGSPDQKGNEVDPSQNPLAFFYQHRSRLRGMNEEDAVKFVDRIFKRFALPKYEKINPQGLDQTKIDEDRKSTRLNSSHSQISYAVFCLKKKNKKQRSKRLPHTVPHPLRNPL